MNYADTNNRHTPEGGSPGRKRRRTVLARKGANRPCPPIPHEWLSDGKSRTAIMENGVLVLVSEADKDGCTAHRPDILDRVLNQDYYLPQAASEEEEG